MKKLLGTIFTILILFSGINTAKADDITLANGIEIRGKIVLILDSIVDIKTKDGIRRITRSFENSQPMDVIEVGFLLKRKVVGQVIHIDENTIHMITPTGAFMTKRILVRNISLKQEKVRKTQN